jgi:threonine/homoserine/homoserine lactone efflux protein
MAVVMVAGPQLVAAIVLATGSSARRDSVFFLLGAAAATTLGVGLAYRLTGLLKAGSMPWSANARLEHAVDFGIIALLCILGVKVFRDRKGSGPPRWMTRLETATPLFASKIGFLLFALFPGDIISMATVGAFLAHHDAPGWQCLVFVGFTVLLVGLPLLFLFLMGRRAADLLPKARNWMAANSWIVSEILIGFFLLMTVKSLLGR